MVENGHSEPTGAGEASPSIETHRSASWKCYVIPSVAGLAACLVTIFFFCPRYYLWRDLELDNPELLIEPELHRAAAVLKQRDDPFAAAKHPSNRVIFWRPLFPFVGRCLQLSTGVFLTLPFVGCWATSVLIYVLLAREFPLRRHALCGTISACATGWFFVSTGWLSYNDSWILLALLTVAFVRSPLMLWTACLAAPWIEERFMVLLPTCLALRALITVEKDVSFRKLFFDVATAVVATSPYLALRIWAYANGKDPVLNDYLQDHLTDVYPFVRYVEGAWAGLRCNWIYVGLWAWLVWSYRPRWFVVFVQLGMIATLVAALKMAGDLHRSAAAFLPVAVAGMILFQRRFPKLSTRLIPFVATLNLLLPASHVITVFEQPIYGLFHEMNRK